MKRSTQPQGYHFDWHIAHCSPERGGCGWRGNPQPWTYWGMRDASREAREHPCTMTFTPKPWGAGEDVLGVGIRGKYQSSPITRPVAHVSQECTCGIAS